MSSCRQCHLSWLSQTLGRRIAVVISFQSIIATKHVVTQPNFTLSLSRSLSRLNQIFFVLIRTNVAQINAFTANTNAANVDDETDNMSFQVQIGSHKFPDNPAEGVGEHYTRLVQALGKQLDHDDVALTPTVFVGNKPCYGIELERCGNEAAYQGINTRDGKVMTSKVNTAFPIDAGATNNIYNVFVVQVYNGFVNLRNGAIDVIE